MSLTVENVGRVICAKMLMVVLLIAMANDHAGLFLT